MLRRELLWKVNGYQWVLAESIEDVLNLLIRHSVNDDPTEKLDPISIELVSPIPPMSWSNVPDYRDAG